MLKRIFGPTRDKVTGERRQFHDELYTSQPSKIILGRGGKKE
jgi:hypothetical protein